MGLVIHLDQGGRRTKFRTPDGSFEDKLSFANLSPVRGLTHSTRGWLR